METKLPRPRGRPRKRKRPEEVIAEGYVKAGNRGKKGPVEPGSGVPVSLLGRYVLKEFNDTGVFLGKVLHYDTGLYRVDYEDGDCEDLESGELRGIIVAESYFDDELNARKRKLDELILRKANKFENKQDKKEVQSVEKVKKFEAATLDDQNGGLSVHDDRSHVEDHTVSSSNLCDFADDTDTEVDTVAALDPPPALPPSSGTIGVPEESVSHLFSVYGFLRSFSIQLYLCPFGLDDFVGALNCSMSNTLMDAIHVALMCAMKRHLDKLAQDGSEPACECLRSLDWSLLDSLTWPVYLVQYFTAMGHITGPYWKGFYESLLNQEYHSLQVGMKLMILQLLCDDVLDVVEVRAEVDIREEMEYGADPDGTMVNPPEDGPRRVHPRNSKISAYRGREFVKVDAESQGMKPDALGPGGNELESSTVNTDMDANSDECRLCGMDGTLLCCDGCPSAYHTRCIGLIKMYIPEGPWYCPECTVNKKGPTIADGTLLRGAEFFGMDCYEQIFLGTCNHLLVLKMSIDNETHLKYYNANDVLKVVEILLASTHHREVYLGICKAILNYLGIPGSVISGSTGMVKGVDGSRMLCFGKESQEAPSELTSDNNSKSGGSYSQNVVISCQDSSPYAMAKSNLLGPSKEVRDNSLRTNLSDRSCLVGFARFTTCNTCYDFGDPCVTRMRVSMYSENEADFHAVSGRDSQNVANNFAYKGLCFKPQAYINHYANGEFAASAAAKLTVLSAEETHDLGSYSYVNARKVASNNISLQLKAFSSVASRFFWPSPERKDIVRERCGWCHSCKLSPSSRRGCMLNAAVANATRSATKVLNSLPPLKNGKSCLASIAAYLLYLEESLRGLIAGPFLGGSYRNYWRKQVLEASTSRTLKRLLLELGENISSIAMSGDWAKLMGDLFIEHSIIQAVTVTAGTAQKRGPGAKRQKKHSDALVEVCDSDSFGWWRGGILSKLVLQKAVLPRSIVRKVASRGGARKIPGFSYADGSEIPKRSRQLSWKAAVESSRTTSQLALQVRYLDMNLRWSDIVRPEQSLQDVKGPETEASVFRNAVICDKQVVNNKVRYAIAFGNQKHLPSRIMKNVIEVEKTKDGKEKYWFSETRIPIYLIKEYEESLHRVLIPPLKKASGELSALQRRQLKASRQDIFSYLACRRDKLEKCSCASCQLDVPLRNTATCNSCQGYCHKECTLSSNFTNGKIELLVTCKRCYVAKCRSQNDISCLLPLGSNQQNSATTPISKGLQFKAPSRQITSIGKQEISPGTKQITPNLSSSKKGQTKIKSWGIIWRKKNNEDTGLRFRQDNILLGGKSDKHQRKPACDLCQQPYNPELTYIHCPTCKKWYHAEAVELEDSKIAEVVGFKCCKCRRIRSPECPYLDPKIREQRHKKKAMKTQKQDPENTGLISDLGIVEPKESKPTGQSFPAENGYIQVQDDDPLLFSLSRVEQITENTLDIEQNTSGPGLRKLPVRRHVKHEDNVDFSTCEAIQQPKGEQSLTAMELDGSNDGVEGAMVFDYETLNYEDMEFEPQTYFSLTELLPSDDAGQCDGLDQGVASGDVSNQHSVVEQCLPYANCDEPESANPGNSVANEVCCQICLNAEPTRDVSCEACGFSIHLHCSPWEEELSPKKGWRCGRCREWR